MYMLVQADALKKGNHILFNNEECVIDNIEISNIGKHGKAKCRLELISSKKEKKVIIVLADEKFELINNS